MKEAGKSAPRGPGGAKSEPSHLKRFYSEVATKDEGVGVGVLLDGKPVRTPGKAPFVVPNKALAEAIGDEWRGQGARIDPATMPLTRLANSVIDGEGPRAGGHRRHSQLCWLRPHLLSRRRPQGPRDAADQALGPDRRLGQAGSRRPYASCRRRDACGASSVLTRCDRQAPYRFRFLEPCWLTRHDRALGLGAPCLGDSAWAPLAGTGLGSGACRRGLADQPMGRG
jgi:hypothetical protein